MEPPRLHTALHHRSPTAFQVPVHRHPHHELVLVLGGNLLVRTAAGILPGTPGSLHLFPAGADHDQGCRGPWHTICLLFAGDAAVMGERPRLVETGEDPLLRGWFSQLCELARDAGDRPTCDALLAAVIHRIGRLERERDDRDRRPAAVERATGLIRSRLDRDLDVAALAREVQLSPSHLGSLFRQHLGASPKQWHAQLRLERARSLLANPYTTVTAVAGELGYTDLNWFVRRFRAAFGVPPGRWRDDLARMTR